MITGSAVDFPDTIILIGMMGCGKSTLGKVLARRLRKPFVDSDDEIVRRTGVSIATIFEMEGEAGFRRREAEVLAEILATPGQVVATGGGAILDDANRATIRSAGTVIYLHASVDTIHERTKHLKTRPLLAVPNPQARLSELYQLRDPLYRETADFVVESDQGRATALLDRLLHRLRGARSRLAAVDSRCKT